MATVELKLREKTAILAYLRKIKLQYSKYHQNILKNAGILDKNGELSIKGVIILDNLGYKNERKSRRDTSKKTRQTS